MAEMRLLDREELKAAIKLSDEVFLDAEQKSMGEAFPAVFSACLNQSYGIFENDKLISFMGVVPSVIQVGAARLSVLSIGAVCTHPEGRGKGYAGRLFAQAKEHAERSGAALMLVSGELPLYMKAGCLHFGSVKYYDLGAGAIQVDGEAKGFAIRERQPTDWLKIMELAAARDVHYEQSIGDLATLIDSEGFANCVKLRHRALVAEKQDGTLGAFAVLAVPDERESLIPPMLVEWAGEADLTASLFTHAFKKYNLSHLMVPVPWQEKELGEALASYPFTSSHNAGTVLIVSPERLFQQLAPYRHSRVGSETNMEFEWQPDGGCLLTGLEEGAVALKPAELVSLFFDPEAKAVQESPVKYALSPLFLAPLPYVAGLNFV